ncbi:hypothetical protein GJ496_009081 [Pomphorhynchus laevis]|nr:hypothetical protein GJ496_009081 [Pomphorhynchus laevis]
MKNAKQKKSNSSKYWKSRAYFQAQAGIDKPGFTLTCRPEDNLDHVAKDVCIMLENITESLVNCDDDEITLEDELRNVRNKAFDICHRSSASKQNVFIKCDSSDLLLKITDVVYSTESMMNHHLKVYPVRLVPVLWTCRAIQNLAIDLINKSMVPFMESLMNETKQYQIQVKSTRNTNLSKDVVFDMICHSLRSKGYERVNSSECTASCPCVYCHVQQKRFCLTLLPKFNERCSYNLLAFQDKLKQQRSVNSLS